MEGGAWWAEVHGTAKSRTRLSDFTFTFHFHALEKEMATYSSVLAWRIPGMGELGGLQSMGSHRVGHDWGYLAAAAAGSSAGKESACNLGDPCSFPGSKIPWRSDRLPTPVFLGFPRALMVKDMPAMQETWVQPLHWEDPGGGTGNPLQYSCLENMDRGAWQATVHRFSKSWTWLSTAQHSTSLNIILYLWQQWDKLFDKVRTVLKNSDCIDKVSIWLYVEVKNHFTLWELTVRRQRLEKINIQAVWCCPNMVGT